MNGDARFSPTRRKLLIGAAGTATLGLVGAGSWSRLKNYRAQWIEQVVRNYLPDIDLDPVSLQTFVDYLLAEQRMQPRVVKATVFADQFIPWLPARVIQARDGLVRLERYVLTEFLMGSNFFRVRDPRQETIVYFGPALACINPFTHSVAST